MTNQQVSVGVNQSGNEWTVKVGEKGTFTIHKFQSEADAQSFVKETKERLGLQT